MRARIFDKASQTFYRSEIYGVVNFGGDRYIAGKCEGGKQIFYLIDYLDYTSEPPYRVNVECIDSNPLPEGMQWEYRQKEELLDLNLILEKKYHHPPLLSFRGCPFLLEQKEWLAELTARRKLPDYRADAVVPDTKLQGWNYIEDSCDINSLMDYFGGFHDSVIREIHYESGDYMEGGTMYLSPSCAKKLRMVFDSSWANSIEIVFESVRLLRLVPPGENYLGDLFNASIFIDNLEVYFYDEYLKERPKSHDGTWVKALGMRWRVIV